MKECEGLWFRIEEAMFFRRNGSGAIQFNKTLVPLKRKTCSGCEECRSIINDIPEIGISNADVAVKGMWVTVRRFADEIIIVIEEDRRDELEQKRKARSQKARREKKMASTSSGSARTSSRPDASSDRVW